METFNCEKITQLPNETFLFLLHPLVSKIEINKGKFFVFLHDYKIAIKASNFTEFKINFCYFINNSFNTKNNPILNDFLNKLKEKYEKI